MKRRATDNNETAREKKVVDKDDDEKDDRLKEFERAHYNYVEDKGDPNKIQSEQEINQRKVVKIKRKVPQPNTAATDTVAEKGQAVKVNPEPLAQKQDQEAEAKKGAGHLTFSSSFTQLTKTQQPSQSVFGSKGFTFSFKPPTPAKDADKNQVDTKNEGSQKTSTSLFANLAKSNSTPSGGSLFGNFKPGEISFKFKNDNKIFASGTSLFGQKNNLFTNNNSAQDGQAPKNSLANVMGSQKAEDSQGAKDSEDITPVKYGDTLSPMRVLSDHPAISESPFQKVYEVETDKFKIATQDKHNFGIGKVSIQKMEIEAKDDSKSKFTIYKVVYKNIIGKMLYDASISNKFSKLRKIPEKAYKNQLKIALVNETNVEENGEKTKKYQVQHCLINFKRNDDLEEFQKHFETAIQELKLKQSESK